MRNESLGNEFRNWMDEKITLTQVLMHKKQLHPDLSLQITIPNEFQNDSETIPNDS